MSLDIESGMRMNKWFCSKFFESHLDRQTPVESRRTQRPKRYINNKDKEICPNVNNINKKR